MESGLWCGLKFYWSGDVFFLAGYIMSGLAGRPYSRSLLINQLMFQPERLAFSRHCENIEELSLIVGWFEVKIFVPVFMFAFGYLSLLFIVFLFKKDILLYNVFQVSSSL